MDPWFHGWDWTQRRMLILLHYLVHFFANILLMLELMSFLGGFFVISKLRDFIYSLVCNYKCKLIWFCWHRMSKPAAEILQKFYLQLRDHNTSADCTPITARQLESLVRLAEARARLELREEVTAQDATVSFVWYYEFFLTPFSSWVQTLDQWTVWYLLKLAKGLCRVLHDHAAVWGTFT